MALQQRLNELTHRVFTRKDRWGEDVCFIPKSDWNAKKTVQAMVDRDSYPGTNEVPGDGRALERPSMRRERYSITIFVGLEVEVQKVQPRDNPDAFLIDGEIWAVKRTLAEDSGGRDLLLVFSKFAALRNWRLTG